MANTEDRHYTWKAGLAGAVLMMALGLGLTMLSVLATMNAARYLLIFHGYDDGALLTVLATFGVICTMGGAYGAVVCYLSTNKKKLKRLQFMVYAYVVWGAALALLCFYTYYHIISCSSNLNVIFQTGFIDRISLYASNQSVRKSVDMVQTELGCCGCYNLTDWFTVQWSPNTSMTEYSIPDSCCDRNSLQVKGLSSCISSVPFGEAIRLTAFKAGCIELGIKYFQTILNKNSLLIIGSGVLQILVTVLVTYELMTLKHVYDVPDKNKERMKLLEASTKK